MQFGSRVRGLHARARGMQTRKDPDSKPFGTVHVFMAAIRIVGGNLNKGYAINRTEFWLVQPGRVELGWFSLRLECRLSWPHIHLGLYNIYVSCFMII